tara:strand:- start:756 stop:959 length:204 start_codon:yes stop_codon:yes gene_type:complete
MNELILPLTGIAITLAFGIIIGVIISFLLMKKENKALSEEVDKFRDLYFNEMDKWKNKYDNDNYEAY